MQMSVPDRRISRGAREETNSTIVPGLVFDSPGKGMNSDDLLSLLGRELFFI